MAAILMIYQDKPSGSKTQAKLSCIVQQQQQQQQQQHTVAT
jgi:hypothetical protein